MMRRGCNAHLRDAVGHWARANMASDPYGRAFYLALRARGHRHERALRGLADRLLACLVATLRNDELYDPQRRARRLPPSAAYTCHRLAVDLSSAARAAPARPVGGARR